MCISRQIFSLQTGAAPVAETRAPLAFGRGVASILVQGLTNSGKTSLVNALSAAQVVPPNPLPNTVDHTAVRRDGAATAARAVLGCALPNDGRVGGIVADGTAAGETVIGTLADIRRAIAARDDASREASRR